VRPHEVAILAQGAEIDSPRQVRDLGARHADAEVVPGDVEPPRPGVVEHLAPAGQHRVDHDVLGPRDVPHEPGQRVEILARADPHLIVGHREGALRRRHRVAAHGRRVHAAVLAQEEVASIHV
jgi:hypothetical protein